MPTSTPTASPTSSSTIGLKNVVIAPLTADTEEAVTYGDLQLVAGAIEAEVNPGTNDPDVQYADDTEYDVLYQDPEISITMRMVDIPLEIQKMLLGHVIDTNGVLIRSTNDKPGYFALGFKSEKANHKYRYVWLYKVRARPFTQNYATKEGTTLNRQTPSVEFTGIKRTFDGNWQAVADEGENGFTAEKAATFLDSVYTPV